MTKSILFLGYDQEQTRLIGSLQSAGFVVSQASDCIPSITTDLTVSFGYRYIIPSHILDARGPIINLHISYLPFNRGSHPNFWSFFDGTPSGVTIHLIDPGVDTGPILFQRRVEFDPEIMTFRETHARLLAQIEDLFMENLTALTSGRLQGRPQDSSGTFHRLRDLPAAFRGWDSVIGPEIRRLKSL